MVDQQLAERLYARAFELARERAAEWRASERDAGNELTRIAEGADHSGAEALRVARDRLGGELLSEAEGDPESVLAHRLLQLALAPGDALG